MASIKYHLKAYITEHVNIIYSTEQKKHNRFQGQNMGRIKDMLYPPCQNMGGDTSHHPPGIYAIAGSTVS